MKSTGLIQLVGNLYQDGRIHNLHQVCGVFRCVAVDNDGSFCRSVNYLQSVKILRHGFLCADVATVLFSTNVLHFVCNREISKHRNTENKFVYKNNIHPNTGI